MTDDPLALRSDRLFRVFARYLRFRIGRAFHALRIAQDGYPAALPVTTPIVVYSNHPGWWDPALYIVLADMLFPERKGFGPMDAEAFARYGILRRMGVFGIALDRPQGARRFLDIARRVLDLRGGMMWITAEGGFVDPRRRPIVLRPGIAHLARLRPDAVFLPLAIGYEFWEESRPEAFVRFGTPVMPAGTRAPSARQHALTAALEATMDALAAATMARDGAAFAPLVRGRAGADLVYDQWRRLASRARGERFRAAHGRGE